MWQNWVNGVLGLWVIVAQFIGLDSGTMQTLMVITGAIVAILAFWNAAGKKGPVPMGQ